MATATDTTKFWQSILAQLELTLSRPTYKTWFGQAKLVGLLTADDHTEITIGVPSAYAQEWIETHYLGQIKKIAEDVAEKPCDVLIQTVSKQAAIATEDAGPLFEESATPTVNTDEVERAIEKAQLNPHYTFDNFIVGASNNLAYTAAKAVAKAAGRIHNPLFIYGGVGCGKTHLLHSVGNAVLQNKPEAHVLYTTCEQFTNDLIESLKQKTTEKFRNKYRKLDVLIIDDIQFIAKSEYSQEEFFNTFNALYNVNHQIIIASDRLPEEIPKLADRLRSRFQGGVIVDVQPPDLEMRIAILHEKAEEFGTDIPTDAAAFIAENYRDNTRELEGALKRVIAAASIRGEPITLAFTQQTLGLIQKELKRRLTPRQVVEAVSKQFNVNMKELTGNKRRHEIVVARQVAMYLLRAKLNLQYERIAEVLGGKDHTTIMYGVDKVENMMENDGDIRGRVEAVLNTLGGR